MRRPLLGWALSSGLLVALIPATAAATPQDLFGFGGRTPALAMTGVSYDCSYESVFVNPAGLACAERRSFVLGFGAGGFQLEIDDERFPVTPHRGMTMGFQLPLPFGSFLEDRLVLGGGFFTPSEVVLRGDVRYPEVPQFPVLERSQVVAIQLGLGIDLHGVVDGLQIGIGISGLADLVGDLFVRLNEENEFSSQVETQLLATFAPILGARFTQPDWAVGVAYRSELQSVMSLDVVTADLPVEVPPLTLGGLVQYDPHTLVLEGSWRPVPEWMLVANLTGRLWSAWPGAQQRTTTSSTLAPDPEFSNTLSPRVAVERTSTDGRLEVSLRGGYAFEPSPAPPARMAPERDRAGAPGELVPMRMLDNDRHVLTAGLGLSYRFGEVERIRVDLWAQGHWLAPRDHQVGLVAGGDPMRTAGFILAAGWVAGAEF